MAFIRLPLGIRIAVEYNWNGKVVVNIYHVTTTDPITTIKLETIANVFKDVFTASLMSFISEQISLSSVSALNLDVPNGERVIVPVVPTVPGSYTGDSVSNNVASVVSLKTALTGRSFQGRSYMSGIPEAEVSQNDLGTTIIVGIGNAFVALTGGLTAVDAILSVASFRAAGVPRGEGVATPVDSFFINKRVDTQRRRLPKT